MAKPFYLTTTLPYVNAEPHIGFALEIIQADIIARFKRLLGVEVFFNTGTDEHGQKIWEKAKEEGEEVQAYVDRYAASVRRLKEELGLSYDAFIRTTDEEHKTAAQALWLRCAESGDIYKKSYEGLYCVGCEKFLAEKDLDEHGNCPFHPGKKPVLLAEENYFFRLSKYQDALEKYLSSASVIVPEHRLKEALEFVRGGLEDFSISRERERLPWGVPVPGDENQVMYVWFDALTNYISTLGWPNDAQGNFKKFWVSGETLQMAGKDQVRFQSIMWQAMLLSAKLPTTGTVFYHGFINSGGQRMSKSLGNVISPFDLVKRYGVEATRYLLARHVHPVEDTDITLERLDEWYEAGLANGLGNQVARIMKLASVYLDTPVLIPPDALVFDPSFKKSIDAFRINEAVDVIWEHIAKADAYIQETQPFKLIKSEDETKRIQAQEIFVKLSVHLVRIATHLRPIMPETAEKILQAVRTNQMPAALFPRKE